MADCFITRKGVNIDTSITYGENIFNYEEFKEAIGNGINGGVVEWDDNVQGFTLIANDDDCYTSYKVSPKYSLDYTKTYELSYEVEKSPETIGNGLLFFNGNESLTMQMFFSADKEKIMFTPTFATTYVTIRFGVRYANNSIKYSNIQLREVISLNI